MNSGSNDNSWNNVNISGEQFDCGSNEGASGTGNTFGSVINPCINPSWP